MPTTTGPSPKLHFEVEGRTGPPVVLIEGLGTQLVGWRNGFKVRLREAGMRLVLMDNRDVGLSDKCGEPGDEMLSYSIADMAGDVTRVLDACDLASAHVVGQSMGGAIAQSLAINHPDRVRSLTLFYTAPSFSGAYIGEAARTRPEPPRKMLSRAEAIALRVEGERFCAGSRHGFDEAWAREAAGLAYDRCPRSDGAFRQRAALAETAEHGSLLGRVGVPTAVIHGRADDIVDWRGGEDVAQAIPGADLHLYAGMGHVVAEPLWPQFAAIIAEVVARGERNLSVPAGD